jgi:hypothetical protein
MLPLSQSTRADYVVTNVWKVLPGAAHIATGDNNRGIAYGLSANKVFVSNKGSVAIDVIDASQGTNGGTAVGSVVTTGVSGGNFAINCLGVADDGVLYGANLNTTAKSSPFYRIYRWADITLAPVTAFAADPTLGLSTQGQRVGDSMAIRGSGTDTQIIAPVSTTTNMILFSTTDGINFTPTVLAVTGLGVLSGVQPGVAFYTNNTFILRPGGNVNSAVYLIQFPANFASLTSPVAATVIATNTSLAVNTANTSSTFFDVNPTAGLTVAYGPSANAATPATVAVNLFGAPPFSGFATALATTNTAHNTANGNGTGGVCLGGPGKTNFIYTLDSNNGVYGFGIAFVAPQPPTISSAPVGATGIYPPYTLTVSANGSQPLTYQWIESPNNVTFTNIPGATSNSYTVANSGTNYLAVIITNSVNSITSSPVLVSLLTPVVNSAVTNLWKISPGASGFSYLSTDDSARGLAYDTNQDAVIVASRTGGPGVYLISGTYGTNKGTLSLSGLSLNGTFPIDQVAVADDGQVYLGNLALIGSGDSFHLYQYPAATNGATATTAFQGDPGNGSGDRWGDYLDARGAGAGTQIILASKTTRVALLTTSDGSTFTSDLITITNVPSGFAAQGITFGAGNTFWAKSYLGHLYLVSFDPVALTGAIAFDYGAFQARCIGVGVDTNLNILGSMNDGNAPKDLELFQLTGSSDSPILFDQVFAATGNANGNNNAVVRLRNHRAYGMDVNNGIVAASYGAPSATAPLITAPPANLTAYINDPTAFFGVGVSGSLPLFYQWRFNGVNISNGTNATLALPNPQPSQQGNYDVVVHNVAGYATSAPPAVLTVISPLSSTVVTQQWRLAGGSRSYLDSSSFGTRGLGYDPASGIVVLADHFSLYFLAATNGSDLGSFTPLGLPTVGINSWTIDQIGVADDSVLYSCNLAQSGGFAIVSYSVPVGPGMNVSQYAYGGSSGGDPSGTGDRFGDTMDVRGAGVSTEILCGSQSGTVVVVFDTSDGVNFTPHAITVTGAPAGFAGQGVAFGSGDTFWAKSTGYNLRLVSYDKNAGTGTVLESYTSGTQVDSGLCGIDVDVANNILAGVTFNDLPNDVKIYEPSGNDNPPAAIDQEFFSSRNGNSQFNATTVLKNGFGAGLDVNNGIVAFTYGTPSAPAVGLTITYSAGTGPTLTWNAFNGHNYQVQYRDSLLTGNWANLGSPVAGTSSNTASYTDNTGSGNTRFYRVISQ